MKNNELRNLQLCELDILKYFIKICDENNLKYFAGGGTLLGAIRHKGFIPWDDDIDVYMPRKDYDKVIAIINNDNNCKYLLKNFEYDKNFVSYQSVLMDKSYKLKLCHTTNGVDRNAWIDIWPLDTMPKNKLLFLYKKYQVLYRRFLYQSSVFDTMVDTKKKRPLVEKFLIFIVKKFNIGKNKDSYKMLKKMDSCLRKKYGKDGYYVNGMSVYKFKNVMPISIYGDGEYYDFEDIKINGPIDYDYFLKRLYGDYMTPPSESEKNRHNIEILKEDD